MADYEKVINGLELCGYMEGMPQCDLCPYDGKQCWKRLKNDAIALLKEQEAEPPVHIHEEYQEHDWYRDENGDIDDFAFDCDFHNGPMCKRCSYAFCIHCDPDGWNKKPCIIDKYKCPKCGKYIIRYTKFCSDCGQEVKWE